MNRSETQVQPFDYFLSFISTAMAIIGTGYSLKIETVGWLFVAISAVGYLFSARLFRPDVRFGKFTLDGILMTLVVLCVFIFAGRINQLLPEGGFPQALLTNGILVMIISFGSFVAWRDSSLIFLGVPAIAIFGLVGAYDTIAIAPVLFFVFLICAGIVYSRANLRTLYDFAKSGGEPDVDRLRQYAWKGIAGPEWAFASAVVVIALSALGAPAIRQTVQLATEPLRVNIRNVANQNNRGSAGIQEGQTAVQVGRGPFGTPSNIPVLMVRMDKARLLRSDAFYTFTENRWLSAPMESTRAPQLGPDFDLEQVNPEGIQVSKPAKFDYSIRVLRGIGDRIPVPGIGSEISGPFERIRVRPDGLLRPDFDSRRGYQFSGVSVEPKQAKSNRAPIPDYVGRTFFRSTNSERVKDLAFNAVKGIESDWERAKALRELVSKTIRYNLQAPASTTSDPVDEVMFETKEGYCDLFATSLAVMAREVGLPSRVATGFLVQEDDREGSEYVVREKDYHMWTEIYFAEMGWVAFDATEGADEVPGSGRGDTVAQKDTFGNALMARLIPILIGLGILGLAIGLAWEKILAWLRSAQVKKTSEVVIKRRVKSFISDAVNDLGKASQVPREFGWTMQEYCSNLSASFPDSRDILTLIANRTDAMLYDGLTHAEDEQKELEALIKQACQQMRHYRKGDES